MCWRVVANSHYSLLVSLRSRRTGELTKPPGVRLVGATGAAVRDALHSGDYRTMKTTEFWFVFAGGLWDFSSMSCVIAETNRAPSRSPEAESNCVAGYIPISADSAGAAVLPGGVHEQWSWWRRFPRRLFLGGWLRPFAGRRISLPGMVFRRYYSCSWLPSIAFNRAPKQSGEKSKMFLVAGVASLSFWLREFWRLRRRSSRPRARLSRVRSRAFAGAFLVPPSESWTLSVPVHGG